MNVKVSNEITNRNMNNGDGNGTSKSSGTSDVWLGDKRVAHDEYDFKTKNGIPTDKDDDDNDLELNDLDPLTTNNGTNDEPAAEMSEAVDLAAPAPIEQLVKRSWLLIIASWLLLISIIGVSIANIVMCIIVEVRSKNNIKKKEEIDKQYGVDKKDE